MAGGSFGTGVGHSRGDSSYGGRGDNTPGSGDRGGNGGGNGGGNNNNRNQPSGSFSSGNQSRGDARAQAADFAASGGRSLGSMRAELDRRDRAAVAALGSDFRNVNIASDVFNDDEEGINSIGEALDRFGSWVSDRVGAGAPGGFAKSDAARGLATLGGFMLGGPWGAGLANFAHSTYSAAPGRNNMIGNAARAVGLGAPGMAGMVGTAVSLLDEHVTDLDKLTVAETMGSVPGQAQSLSAPAGNRATLGNQYPGGSQGGDNPLLKTTASTALSAARTGDTGSDTKKPNPNTIRRTLSPLNISYAKLRGIEELL